MRGGIHQVVDAVVLLPGLNVAQLEGKHKARNPLLADWLQVLGYVERFGIGILRMSEAMQQVGATCADLRQPPRLVRGHTARPWCKSHRQTARQCCCSGVATLASYCQRNACQPVLVQPALVIPLVPTG
jgi:hypothetical protein